MEFLHVFYKEISVNEKNIFSANLADNNDVDQIKFDNLKHTQSAGCQLTKIFNPMSLY